MNSAHLKALREQSGLSAQDAANTFGVSLRTWQYWESPKATEPPKPDVLAGLTAYIHRQAATAEAALENAEMGHAMLLTRYRTQEALDRSHPGFPGGLKAHDAMMRAALFALIAEGYDDAEMVWDDDPRALIGTDWA